MSMALEPETLMAALARLIPAPRLLTEPGALAAYESDGLTTFRARPRAVVLAESQADVIETVRLCHAAHVPFMARGSGTSLSGGAVPIEDGIVIALNRLNRILRMDPATRTAVVEPGVVNLDVTAAAAPHGLYYAPDPSSQSVCTIGGNVAFNSGGAHCFRHGMTANHVLGLKIVLPDGEVTELGGNSLESIGPDLAGLFVGSEGLFGIALEVTLRLVPRPEAYRTLLAAYDSLQAAGDAVSRIIAAGLLPGAMEIMDRLAIEAAEAAVDAGYPRHAAAILLVELEGDALEVAAEFAQLMRLVEESGATATRTAADAADRARIWKGRKCAFSAVGRLSPDFIVQDGVVPRTRLGEALATIQALAATHRLRVANVFHAGDGNLHPLILFDGREAGALERAERLSAEILQMCIRLGGSITGEHGIGLEKRRFLGDMYAAADLAFMRRLRQSLDPREIANRGKMLEPAGAGPPPRGLHPLERDGVISRI
jgi:glycolate oxidase